MIPFTYLQSSLKPGNVRVEDANSKRCVEGGSPCCIHAILKEASSVGSPPQERYEHAAAFLPLGDGEKGMLIVFGGCDIGKKVLFCLIDPATYLPFLIPF